MKIDYGGYFIYIKLWAVMFRKFKGTEQSENVPIYE